MTANRSSMHLLRNAVRRVISFAHPARRAERSLSQLDNKSKFTAIYRHHLFKGTDSRSGEGSNLQQTAIIRKAIPELIHAYDIRSMVDAPCGDWHWMRTVDLTGVKYTGVDIVEELIRKNAERYASEHVNFRSMDIATGQLPRADLIFTRDCLVHLSFADASKIIQNFCASGAAFLLSTTFTNRNSNSDLGTSFWRPLNMQKTPFNFPEPIALINEGCTEGNGAFSDKCLGLWRIADIASLRQTELAP